jgi:hypothetical protein
MSFWQAVGEVNAAFALLVSDAVQRSPHSYLEPLGVGVFHVPEANTDTLQFALYLDAVRVIDLAKLLAESEPNRAQAYASEALEIRRKLESA